ncbi:MAG: glycerol-3-phosphate dehydrogenase/oxidase, partial [Bdellovibrionales bacterium]|nr:glycerol-3-phosphate dehydrogenase/oxidase [Bdellovibrionales bacterium]
MNKEFSAETRQKNIKNLSDQVFDLLIIGGGINGAGIARDAASRGLTVALVEMNDFASGTSSRSSKLIHGGLRYLENLDFHLVFEALSERAKLFEIAPHLVHPLRFLVPLYKTGRVGPFKMGLGMWLYDVLALFDTPKMHCYYSSQEAIQRVPVLKPTLLNGAFEYSDAYMDDDRLVIETLRSANEAGAVAVNYVSAKQPLVNDQGELTGFECVDLMSDSKFNVKARHIVSTVGPWTDQIGNKVYSDWKPIMRPSKGVHLTFSKEDFQIPCAVVMAAEQRIVFAIPRNEMVIVGTTDTDFKEDPSSIKTERKDVEYLLNVINDYFPGVQVTEEKIISSYSGVRPLVDDGAASEGKTSREHTIKTDKKRHFTYVAGGKYTTYRLIAEQAVDSILEDFSF